MADDRKRDRDDDELDLDRPVDRRHTPSPWSQPQTYISIVLAAITIGTILWNSARTAESNARMGRDIQALSNDVRQLQGTITQFALNDNDRKKDVEYVLREMVEIKNTMGTIEKAYQVQVGQRLVALEIKNGVKPPGSRGD